MNTERILEELLSLLEANGVKIRRDNLGGSGGGMCKIKNENFIFIDNQAAGIEKARVCAEAVAEYIDDLEDIYLLPEIREFIENTRK